MGKNLLYFEKEKKRINEREMYDIKIIYAKISSE